MKNKTAIGILLTIIGVACIFAVIMSFPEDPEIASQKFSESMKQQEIERIQKELIQSANEIRQAQEVKELRDRGIVPVVIVK